MSMIYTCARGEGVAGRGICVSKGTAKGEGVTGD